MADVNENTENCTIKIRQKYKMHSKNWLNTLTCPEYLIKTELFLKEHAENIILTNIKKEEFLTNNLDELLQKPTGLPAILYADNANEDLERLYTLFSCIDGGLIKIAERIKIHIKQQCNSYEAKIDNELIQILIDLHTRLLKIINYQFQKDEIFHKMLKDVFEELMNKDDSMSVLLADFTNSILKKGSKINFSDLENTINQVATLYEYIKDRDIFGKEYQKHFVNRILYDLSESDSCERYMLGTFGYGCCNSWKRNVESVFKDVRQKSKELSMKFRERQDFLLQSGPELLVFGFIRHVDELLQLKNKYIPESIWLLCLTLYNALWEIKENENLDFNVTVCSQDTWPKQSAVPMNYPVDIIEPMKEFKGYYYAKYIRHETIDNDMKISEEYFLKYVSNFTVNGKKLDFSRDNQGEIKDVFTRSYWDNVGTDMCDSLKHSSSRVLNFVMSEGKAEVFVQFNALRKKVLNVSTFQMMILLCFNNKTTYTFQEILDATGMPTEGLKVAILSMCHPKIKVMRKAPNTKEIEMNHKFQINPRYSNPRAKINVPTLRIKEQTKIINDGGYRSRLRTHVVDAAIVRVMKTRISMKHVELVCEVQKQCGIYGYRFTLKPVDIKKRIYALIELDYLERDDNDRQMYHYKP
eukprot:96515_1